MVKYFGRYIYISLQHQLVYNNTTYSMAMAKVKKILWQWQMNESMLTQLYVTKSHHHTTMI